MMVAISPKGIPHGQTCSMVAVIFSTPSGDKPANGGRGDRPANGGRGDSLQMVAFRKPANGVVCA